jgi:transcriptional regulator
MYIPEKFQNSDRESIYAFIRRNGFGILVSKSLGPITATHTPLELSDDGTKLFGHISQANPQAKDFKTGEEVLVIFHGPHAYISSSWYDHENVPTWNYIAAHVYGSIEVIEGEKLIASLKHLVDKYEQASDNPVSVERMSPKYLESQVRGIIGFEIQISRVEAVNKLSQNRDKKNYTSIIEKLEHRNESHDHEIADAMRKTFNHNTGSVL